MWIEAVKIGKNCVSCCRCENQFSSLVTVEKLLNFNVMNLFINQKYTHNIIPQHEKFTYHYLASFHSEFQQQRILLFLITIKLWKLCAVEDFTHEKIKNSKLVQHMKIIYSIPFHNSMDSNRVSIAMIYRFPDFPHLFLLHFRSNSQTPKIREENMKEFPKSFLGWFLAPSQ